MMLGASRHDRPGPHAGTRYGAWPSALSLNFVPRKTTIPALGVQNSTEKPFGKVFPPPAFGAGRPDPFPTKFANYPKTKTRSVNTIMHSSVTLLSFPDHPGRDYLPRSFSISETAERRETAASRNPGSARYAASFSIFPACLSRRESRDSMKSSSASPESARVRRVGARASLIMRLRARAAASPLAVSAVGIERISATAASTRRVRASASSEGEPAAAMAMVHDAALAGY